MESAEWILADGVMNRAVILAGGLVFAPDMDLAAERVQVFVNGVAETDGLGANAMSGPVEVMTWLANDLSARGKGLRAGDVVATGLICDVVQAVPGARVEARFKTLGSVSVTVE